jgi:hypothetical protein
MTTIWTTNTTLEKFGRCSGKPTTSFRKLVVLVDALRLSTLPLLLDIEEKPRLASHFDQVAKLANQPIHYRLDYPRRFEDLARIREAIVAHTRSGGELMQGHTDY